jgi:hypothetical protein
MIEQARDNANWFDSILLSSIQLERHGYFAIKKHLESLKLKVKKDDLEKLHLVSIGLFLLALQKFDERDYADVCKINSVRNKMMHRRDAYKFSPTFGQKAKEEYEPLVNGAIRILEERLGVARFSVGRGKP